MRFKGKFFWPGILPALVWIAVAAFAAVWLVIRNGDVASVVVGLAVLFFAAWTVRLVAPRAGELWIERQEELDLDDLIFFVYPQPAESGQQQVPRDYLLQLHVAVVNVGGRKVVLS